MNRFTTGRFVKVAVAGVVALVAGVAIVTTASAEPCEVEVTITEMTPARGFASGGTELTFTGANFQACAIERVSFEGADSDDVTATADDELTVVTPPGRGTVVPRLHYGDNQFADASAFTYVPVPVIERLLPPSGPAGGGTALAVWGSDLIGPDATTEVRFGDQTVGTTIVPESHLEALSPVAEAGTVDVSVVITLDDTGEEGTSAAQPFTYVAAPIVTSIDADNGNSDGGDIVEITGSDFQRGARVLLGRADGASADPLTRFAGSDTAPVVEFVDSGVLRVMTPRGVPGIANLIVANPDDQIGVLLDAFTYSGDAPSVTDVSPSTGPSLGGTPITITGTGFLAGATVELGSGDTRRAAQSVVVTSSTEITAITPAHPVAADTTITITNPDRGAATLPDAFTYEASDAPSLTSREPASGSSLGGTQLTLNGIGFADGAVVRFGDVEAGGSEAPAAVIDAGRITVASPPHEAGSVEVLVVNPDGATSSAITYTFQAAPVPTIGEVSPITGPTGGGTLVTITGTGFADGADVFFGDVAVTAEIDAERGSVLPIVRNATTIAGRTQPRVAGVVDVVVVNRDGATATASAAFEFEGSDPATIESITPDTGTTAGGLEVTLAGENFAAGSLVTFGNGACAPPAPPACNPRAVDVVIESNKINAVTPAGLFGYQNVTVVGPDGTTSTLRYGFDFGDGAPAPSIDEVDPSVGATGATVTFTGSGFVAGAQAFIGAQRLGGVIDTDTDGVASSLPIVRDDSTVEGIIPRRRSGTFPVAVTNPDGQGTIVVDAFSYPVDTTPPVTTAAASTGTPPVAHPFGATNWARGPVSVVLEATDGPDGSGVDTITYSASGAQHIPSTTVSGTQATLLITAQGLTTLTYGATDIAQMAEEPSTRSVAIDSIAPTITATSTVVPGTQTNQDVDVSFECVDSADGSGLGDTPLTVASNTPITEEGDNPLTSTFTEAGVGQSVTATCTDRAGNVASKVFGGVNISRDEPTLTAVATTADGRPYESGTWTKLNVVVTFVCRAPASIGPLGSPQIADVTAPVVISTGATDLDVAGSCTDSAGNVVTASFDGIFVDKTLPQVSVAATRGDDPYTAGSWTNGAVNLTFTCTDAGENQSGVASISEPVQITSAGTTAGGSGSCVDHAGNRADPAVFLGPILIDLEPPTCSVIVTPNPLRPPNGHLVPVNVTVSATDLLAGVDGITLVSVTSNRPASAASDIVGFSVDTADTTGSLRASRGNVYTLTYVVRDRAGNLSAPCTADVNVG